MNAYKLRCKLGEATFNFVKRPFENQKSGKPFYEVEINISGDNENSNVYQQIKLWGKTQSYSGISKKELLAMAKFFTDAAELRS